MRWLVVLALLSGCSGLQSFHAFRGVCGEGYTSCQTRCEPLRDPDECLEQCFISGRRCSQQQGDSLWVPNGGAALAHIVEKALLVDLSGAQIEHSDEVVLETQGAFLVQPGRRAMAPGATIKATFSLPAGVKSAELVLTHAPDGSPCFVTLRTNGRVLASRYAPPPAPAGATLRRETWRLTPVLRGDQAAQQVEIFIYNNQAAGSLAAYRIGTIELRYEVIEGGHKTSTRAEPRRHRRTGRAF